MGSLTHTHVHTVVSGAVSHISRPGIQIIGRSINEALSSWKDFLEKVAMGLGMGECIG